MRVSLLVTCLVDIFYPRVGISVVEVLERQGCTVDFPEKQTCCGQPAYSSGYSEETKKVAKHMIQTFRDSEYVVSPSGSCTTMIQEYPRLFAEDPEWREQAIRLAAKTFEFTQFLIDVLQVDDVGATFSAKATYHTSCHMTRLLGVTEAPIKLLKNVKELECIELPKKELCCGFGGTFSVKMSPISEQMVDEKIEHIEKTEADVLIGADCSCLMNIGGRIDRRKKPIEVFHIAEVLNSKGETR